MRRTLRGTLAALLVTVALVLSGSPAAAHVLLAQAQPNGDGSTTLTFTFDHGCGESPTTELVVSLPPGATPATRTSQPNGWRAEVGASTVSWSGPAIESGGAVAEFELVTRLAGTIGQPLHFPTVQRCADGQAYDWISTDPAAEHPAPSLIATGAILAPVAVAPRPADPVAGTEGAAGLGTALAGLAVFVVAAAAAGLLLKKRISIE